MANPKLRALYVALALATAACDARPDRAAQSSITVKLPPARPHTAAPSFSFKASGKAAQQERF